MWTCKEYISIKDVSIRGVCVVYVWYYVWTVFLYKEYISVKSMSFWQVSPEGYSCMKSISLQGLFSMNILLVWKSLCKDYRKGPMSVSKGLCLYQGAYVCIKGRMSVSRVYLFGKYVYVKTYQCKKRVGMKNIYVWRVFHTVPVHVCMESMYVGRVSLQRLCLVERYLCTRITSVWKFV